MLAIQLLLLSTHCSEPRKEKMAWSRGIQFQELVEFLLYVEEYSLISWSRIEVSSISEKQEYGQC